MNPLIIQLVLMLAIAWRLWEYTEAEWWYNSEDDSEEEENVILLNPDGTLPED